MGEDDAGGVALRVEEVECPAQGIGDAAGKSGSPLGDGEIPIVEGSMEDEVAHGPADDPDRAIFGQGEDEVQGIAGQCQVGGLRGDVVEAHMLFGEEAVAGPLHRLRREGDGDDAVAFVGGNPSACVEFEIVH